jgi:hypothetical protein
MIVAVLAALIFSLSISLIFLGASQTKNTIVNLALKKNNETYVFSKLGSFITKISIEKNESPSVFPFLQVFDDEGLFVSPDNLEDIVNVIGGNYELFPYKEKSYEGYFTGAEESLYQSNNVNRSTEVVGQQMRENTITLSTLNSSDIFEIVYEQNPKSGDYTAIRNCELKSFRITRSYRPGESTTSSEDYLMVNLDDIVTFYDPNIKLELNDEEQLLYVIFN